MSGPSHVDMKLPARQRLADTRVFARLKASGRRMPVGSFVANWELLSPQEPSRLGVITSRKLGGSVVRSRARRLLREAFRLHQQDMVQPSNLILIARASIVGRDFSGVERDFLKFLRQAGLARKP